MHSSAPLTVNLVTSLCHPETHKHISVSMSSPQSSRCPPAKDLSRLKALIKTKMASKSFSHWRVEAPRSKEEMERWRDRRNAEVIMNPQILEMSLKWLSVEILIYQTLNIYSKNLFLFFWFSHLPTKKESRNSQILTLTQQEFDASTNNRFLFHFCFLFHKSLLISWF